MKERKSYLDLIRIIACFLVIYVHTPSANTQNIVSQIFSIFARCNVPLFFMISGATLLGKNETLKYIWTKRIPRIVILIFVFGVLGLMAQMNFDIKSYIKLIGSNQVIYYWWYLFAYLAALICLPFLRAMAQNLSKTNYIYLLGLYVFGAVVWGLCNSMSGMPYNEYFKFPIVTEQYIFLMMMGYFLSQVVSEEELQKKIKTKYTYLLVIVVCIVFSLLLDDFFVLNNLIAVCVFAFIRVAMHNKAPVGGKANLVLAYIGNLTLGIYMIEPIITVHLRLWLDNFLTSVFPIQITIISTLIATAVSMVVTGAGIVLLKSIPGVKRIVGYLI